MIIKYPNTSLDLEDVKSGFIGYPVIFYVWHKSRLVAYSMDKGKSWRIMFKFIP